MVAAEEMGHKGIRAMSPLDSILANALRVKLGKGRDLPEEPKPKRVPKVKELKEGGDAAAAIDEAVAKRPARAKKAKTEEEAPADIKPAATIVKPKPVAPDVVPEPAPPAPIPEPEIVPEPIMVTPLDPEVPAPKPAAPPPVPVAPGRPVAPAAVAPVVAPPPLAPAPAAVTAPAAVAVEEPPAPAEARRELIRVPESVTVGELAEKMRRKSGEVIKA